jgi:hypothetical protein
VIFACTYYTIINVELAKHANRVAYNEKRVAETVLDDNPFDVLTAQDECP